MRHPLPEYSKRAFVAESRVQVVFPTCTPACRSALAGRSLDRAVVSDGRARSEILSMLSLLILAGRGKN
jgi:hypothetical protein